MSITTIEGAVWQILRNTTAVSTLTTQIYANTADQAEIQESTAYVVIIKDEQEDTQTHGGVVLSEYVVITDVYHEDLATAVEICEAIKATLQDYEGTVGSVDIQEMWQSDETMARNDESDLQIYRIMWAARRTY